MMSAEGLADAAAGRWLSGLLGPFQGDLLWFALGCALLHAATALGFATPRLSVAGLGPGPWWGGRRRVDEPQEPSLKEIRAEAASGTPRSLLAAWDLEKDRAPMPADVLGAVTRALVAQAPGRLVAKLAGHLERHQALAEPQVVHSLMDTIALAGRPDLAEALSEAACAQLRVAPEARSREVLLAGYAMAGDQDRVAALLAEQPAAAQPTPQAEVLRLHAAVVRGHLRARRADGALGHLLEMQRLGLWAPSGTVTEVVRLAAGQGPEVLARALSCLEGRVPLPPEAAELAGAAAAAAPRRRSRPARGS